jgi:hypothetical protein
MKLGSQADSSIGFKDIKPGDIVCFTAGEHADDISNLIVLLYSQVIPTATRLWFAT